MTSPFTTQFIQQILKPIDEKSFTIRRVNRWHSSIENDSIYTANELVLCSS